MDERDPPRAYGVFKPVGHVLASFPDESSARAALSELDAVGIAASERYFFSADEVREQAARDIEGASTLASIGQELNLVRAHHELASQGHPFVAAKASDDEQARAIADVFARHHADRAQHYGTFIIEELIEPGTGEQQVSESPSRGLDAQTLSGEEKSRNS
jgi:hypothetical protein